MNWQSVGARVAGWARGRNGGREAVEDDRGGGTYRKSAPKAWVGAAVAAAAALLGTGRLCQAQPEVFYYQGLTEQENADVVAWSVLYWQRVDQGGGSPGESFSFTNPTMNSHLFNPVRSARPTLELVGSIPEGYCDRMYEVGIPDDELGARAALRDIMLYGEITTDVEEDPWGSWEHLQLIMAAPPDSGVLAWNENGELISVELPLEEVSGIAAEAAMQLNLSSESQTVLATLISAGGYWATSDQSGDVPQWKALITGEASKAEQFRARVDGYLALAGVPDASTQVIQANFGLFGELPVIGVRLSDCYVLMDPTNGNLSGPFESDSPLDARGLLSFHAGAYEAGKAVRYYNVQGCTAFNVNTGCTPGPGPWTLGPVVDTQVCQWVLLEAKLKPVTGGMKQTCSYEARHSFTQTRTCTFTKADCTTYTCTQIRTGYAVGSTVWCIDYIDDGEPPPACSPHCLGPASGDASCSATAPTVWEDWGPPCPQ